MSGGLAMGIGATVLMDLWAVVLSRLAGVAPPNWAMVGRWVGHLSKGVVFHDDIADAQPVAQELRLGWVFHYVVGAIYGVVLVSIVGVPTFIEAWVFALVTIGFGWFLLHPGLGLGWAASKVPEPGKARAMGLVAHTVFGVGLWGVSVILS